MIFFRQDAPVRSHSRNQYVNIFVSRFVEIVCKMNKIFVL